MKPLTVEEAKTLLRAVRGDRLEALYAIAVTTGLRQAEILGLTWDAVDLDTGTLHMNRSLQRIGGRYQLVDVKTRLSRREVAMPASVRERVREHRRRQLEERVNLGPEWHNDLDLVFTTDRGRPLHGTVVTHTFQARLEAACLRRIRFHDLRHSCDTLLQALGVPPRVVMDILRRCPIRTCGVAPEHGLEP